MQILIEKCGLFSDDPTIGLSSSTPKSEVSLSDFRAFVAVPFSKRHSALP
jgi:hypothetical protein